MRASRSLFLIALFVMLTVLPSFANAEVEEVINEQYGLARDGEVHLKNISGNIKVSTWSKNEIRIKARKTANTKEDLDKIDVDIDSHERYINIKTDYDRSFNINPFSFFSHHNRAVHYELTVPEMAEITLESVSGSVEVNSVGGDTGISTVSGEIKVISAGDDVRSKSVSGSVYLEGVAGDTSVETVSGQISVKEMLGQTYAKSVSGGIDIESSSVIKSIEGNTVSGSIRAKGALSPEGVYDLKTVSGSIKLQLPPGSKFDLLAKTASGGIHSDFDLTISGRINSKNINGVVGKGGARLILNSFSGSIRLVKE